jgi:branched-chain amino acid transport system substrate-binding protein
MNACGISVARRFKSVSLVLAFVVVLGAIGLAGAEDVIKFGVHGPMTGPAAETGLAIKRASQLAMEEINARGGILGKKLECIWGDTESKPEVGVSVYERFITRDKVEVVIGGLHSSVAIAMMEAASKYDSLFFIGAPVSSIISKKIEENPEKYWMIFKGDVSSRAYGPGAVELVESLGKQGFKPKTQSFCSIIEDTDFGRSVIADIERPMAASGWKNLVQEVVKIDQADYTAQMSKFRGLKPDVIISVQTSVAAAASLCKTFRESRIPALFLVVYAAAKPEYIKLTGAASNGVVWLVNIAMIPALSKDFVGAFQKRFNEVPPLNAAMQYDYMMIVTNVIQTAGSAEGRKVADALLKTKYEGNCGVHAYSPKNHEVMSGADYIPTLAYQIQKKKDVIIWPSKYAQGKFQVPRYLK